MGMGNPRFFWPALKMGLCLWSVIQAKHAFDDVTQRRRNRQCAHAAPVSALRCVVFVQRSAESRPEVNCRARQLYTTLGRAGMHYRQAVSLGKFDDLVHIGLRSRELTV